MAEGALRRSSGLSNCTEKNGKLKGKAMGKGVGGRHMNKKGKN